MSLTDHDRRQLAGRWAKRWPEAMLNSPHLAAAERAKCRRRITNRRREAKDARRTFTYREHWGLDR